MNNILTNLSLLYLLQSLPLANRETDSDQASLEPKQLASNIYPIPHNPIMNNPISYDPISETASTHHLLYLDGDGGSEEMSVASTLLADDDLQLEALTTVAGNVGCRQASRNMRALISWLGYPDIPTYPCYEKANAYDGAHGSNGLGGVSIPDSVAPVQTQPAHEALMQKLEANSDQSAVIFSTGPLTNTPSVS